MKLTIAGIMIALTIVGVIGCGGPGEDSEGWIRTPEPKTWGTVTIGCDMFRENPDDNGLSYAGHLPNCHEHGDNASESVFPLRMETVAPADNGTRAHFAQCLDAIGQEVALLPWDFAVRDAEDGNSWNLGHYGRTTLESFRLLHCRHLAPVAAGQDRLNRCVIENVRYIRNNYPGAPVQQDALLFALTVCVPPYGG